MAPACRRKPKKRLEAFEKNGLRPLYHGRAQNDTFPAGAFFAAGPGSRWKGTSFFKIFVYKLQKAGGYAALSCNREPCMID